MKGLAKKDITFYVRSENNVTNLLTKFNLQEDSVDHWFKLQQKIFNHPLLNTHPEKLYSNLLNISWQKIQIHTSGGVPHPNDITVMASYVGVTLHLPPYSTPFPPRNWSVCELIAN